MNKRVALLLIAVLAVSSLIAVKPAHAEASISKPSVPEFTLKLVEHPYDVATTYSTDPYTGENVTHAGYHVENKSIEVSIKNQPFTPYEIQENENNWSINFFYNIRVKGHFGQDWNEVYHPSDGFPRQSDSEYTVESFSSTEGEDFYATSTSVVHAPSGGQVDFQVEAMVGYVHREISIPVPGTGWVFTGEASGWSNTQTLTINASAPITTPDDGTTSKGGTHEGTTSDEATQRMEQSAFILGAVVIGVVVCAGLGLLVYFKKRNRQAPKSSPDKLETTRVDNG
jgi:hypothetical protein